MSNKINGTTEVHEKKGKRHYRVCKYCGHIFNINRAKCPSCSMWDTGGRKDIGDENDGTTLLSDSKNHKPLRRISTGSWDKIFSGKPYGIVTTSVTLIGGAPGAGKSTMSLQLADIICQSTNREIIYIGTEETREEINERACRLKLVSRNRIRLYPMGNNREIGGVLRYRKPCAIILDSLQGLTNDPQQAVEVCETFKQYSIELDAPVIIIDHITKDGDLAGLMTLQHSVDTIMTLFPYYEADQPERVLATIKNRYTATMNMHLMMTEKGLTNAKIRFDEEEE